MALARAETAAYPLPAYGFRVDIDGETLGFAEVSGLEIEHETLTYRHGLSAWEGERITRFRPDRYQPVTFRRGVRRGGARLYDWLLSPAPKAVEVSLCDEQGVAVVTWRIRKALPVKLSAPGFDANANEVAIESLEVMAAGVSIDTHD